MRLKCWLSILISTEFTSSWLSLPLPCDHILLRLLLTEWNMPLRCFIIEFSTTVWTLCSVIYILILLGSITTTSSSISWRLASSTSLHGCSELSTLCLPFAHFSTRLAFSCPYLLLLLISLGFLDVFELLSICSSMLGHIELLRFLHEYLLTNTSVLRVSWLGKCSLTMRTWHSRSRWSIFRR